MDATNYLVSILSSAAVSTVLSGVLVWIVQNLFSERIKNSIKHRYDVELEKMKSSLQSSAAASVEEFKARLQGENSVAIEQLKSSLQIAAMERQVRFSKIYETIAESVAKTHSQLQDLLLSVQQYTSILETKEMGSKGERREKMVNALTEFSDHFRRHRLYFSKEIVAKIEEFIEKIYTAGTDFMWNIEKPDEPRGYKASNVEEWRKVVELVKNEAQPHLLLLEEEFRRILGVSLDVK